MRRAYLRDLERVARRLRQHTIRMLLAAGSGHPGSSLSAADLLAALYFRVLRHRPLEPDWPDRDRFVLSKGHAAPVLYAALAEAGYFPLAWLSTLRQLGSPLQGHPDRRRLPGIEASTGSLGQGLSIGMGMALAGRLDRRDLRVFVLLGDGEINEGQVWRDADLAVRWGLSNLVAIVDRNRFQLDGASDDILRLGSVAEKWQAFGWCTQEIDGHDLERVVEALETARGEAGAPHLIVAHTVKGKGVSFMENNNDYHGVAPTPEEAKRALAELGLEEGP